MSNGPDYPGILWISPSAIKQFVRCERSSSVKTESNEVMDAGKVRHALIAAYYQQGLNLDSGPDVLRYCEALAVWRALGAELKAAVIQDVMAARKKPGFLPDPDLVLSCEASDIPALYSYRFPDKEMGGFRELVKFQLFDGKVPLRIGDKEVWARMAWDLCFVDPSQAATLRIPDWKGRSEEDEEVAAAFYGVGAGRIFPGYAEYAFETRHLGSNKISEPYRYPVKDHAEIEAQLCQLVRKYFASDRTIEQLNKYCHSCALATDCKTYQAASTTPIAPTTKAAKALPAPASPEELIREYNQVKLTRSVAEAREESLKALVVALLEKGNVTVDGMEHYLGDHKGAKELLEAAATDFAETFDIPQPEIAGVRRDLFEQAVGEKRTQIPAEIKKDFDDQLAACYTQKTTKTPKTRKVAA